MPAHFHSKFSVTAEGEHLGYPWAVVTVPTMGHFCAYVGVTKDHPWWGKSDHEPPEDLDVHGGVTYGKTQGDTHWLGWDYAHAGDFLPGRAGWYSDEHDKRWTLDEVTEHAHLACAQAAKAATIQTLTPSPLSPLQAEWLKRVDAAFTALKLPGYMLGGVQRYLLEGVIPGGFLTAVFCDDFYRALGHADNANSEAIGGWIKLLRSLPTESFGSRAVVDAWAKHQGLMYQERGA